MSNGILKGPERGLTIRAREVDCGHDKLLFELKRLWFSDSNKILPIGREIYLNLINLFLRIFWETGWGSLANGFSSVKVFTDSFLFARECFLEDIKKRLGFSPSLSHSYVLAISTKWWTLSGMVISNKELLYHIQKHCLASL